MIGGFVKNEEIGFLDAHGGEGDAALLSSRKREKRLERQISGNAELTELTSVKLDRLPGHFGLDELDAIEVHVQLVDVVLGEVAQLQLPMPESVTFDRVELAEEDLEDGRFSCAVFSDDADLRFHVGGKIYVLEDWFVLGVVESHFVYLEDRRRDGFGFRPF